jgi:hypothetical protein
MSQAEHDYEAHEALDWRLEKSTGEPTSFLRRGYGSSSVDGWSDTRRPEVVFQHQASTLVKKGKKRLSTNAKEEH